MTNDNKTSLTDKELEEWINLNEQLHIDQSTGKLYRENIGPYEKFKAMFLTNPLVPIGMACTTASLAMGLRKFTEGAKNQGFWMGCRVGFQGLTVVALCVGAVMADRQQAQRRIEQSQKDTKVDS